MKYLVILFCMVIAGCVTVPSAPQVVKIPITTRCEPSIKITESEHPFDKATTSMTLHDKLELALADLSLTKAENKQLSAALKECTSEPTKSP